MAAPLYAAVVIAVLVWCYGVYLIGRYRTWPPAPWYDIITIWIVACICGAIVCGFVYAVVP